MSKRKPEDMNDMRLLDEFRQLSATIKMDDTHEKAPELRAIRDELEERLKAKTVGPFSIKRELRNRTDVISKPLQIKIRLHDSTDEQASYYIVDDDGYSIEGPSSGMMNWKDIFEYYKMD